MFYLRKEIKMAYANKGLASAAAKRKGMDNYDVREKNGGWVIIDLSAPLYNFDAREKSKVEGACGMVWDIAAEMLDKGAKRKEILDACVEAGVALNTARTQYQRYREAAGLVKARA